MLLWLLTMLMCLMVIFVLSLVCYYFVVRLALEAAVACEVAK